MNCLKCNLAEMEELLHLSESFEVMDDHYYFQCPECGGVEKIHYYMYEAMMDYSGDYEEEAMA